MESLVGLMILVMVFGLLYYCCTLLPLPDPFKKAVLILVILIFVLILIYNFLPVGTLPHWRYPRR